MISLTALAEPNRSRIIEMLAQRGQMAAGDIAREFSISPPAISQHLKVLKSARLVSVQIRGQQRLYSIDPAGLSEVERWIRSMRQHWEERFAALDDLLRYEP